MNLKNITADKLVALYRNRDLTVSEVITNVYDEIERTDGDIRAFISLCRDRAVEEARRMDVKIAAGDRAGARRGRRTCAPAHAARAPGTTPSNAATVR